MELILGYRQSGKSTKLIETGIEWMGENEGMVYFLGFDFKWRTEIYKSMTSAGLVDFRMLSSNDDLSHKLRGISGLLLIDDMHRYTPKQMLALGDLLAPAESIGFLQIKASWDITPSEPPSDKTSFNFKRIKNR